MKFSTDCPGIKLPKGTLLIHKSSKRTIIEILLQEVYLRRVGNRLFTLGFLGVSNENIYILRWELPKKRAEKTLFWTIINLSQAEYFLPKTSS